MDKKEQHRGGLSSGFLLGVVVGVIVTLLLTTKRGKRILKLITEEGMNKLTNWEDMFGDMVEEYETKPEPPKVKPLTFLEEKEEEHQQPVEIHVAKPHKEKHEEEKSPKRFFKGIHRRSVN
jgi:gas vesicle protein